VTRPGPRAAPRSVVLLRAVNVGNALLTMDRFRRALSEAGWESVETVGASGDAVGRPPEATAPALELRLERAVREHCGIATEALVRSAEEWEAAVRGNPFAAEAEDDPAHLVLLVLKAAPSPGAWPELARSIVGRERVAPGGRDGYAVYPDGLGRSRLTMAAIERRLGVRGTARNWNTVLRLAERLADGPGSPGARGAGPRLSGMRGSRVPGAPVGPGPPGARAPSARCR
jgi:uncharacterized protein (DUF1697 family)